MKTARRILAFSLLGLAALGAQAQPRDSGYATDASGRHVSNPFDLCWRTGYWTPALAVAECDPDLVPKPAAGPAPAPAPVAPPPAAKPAPPAPKPVFERVTFSADVLFDFDRPTLREEGRAKLDQLAAQMAGVQVEVSVVIGHADRIGSRAYNQKLSERRAESVKAHLVSKGVAANRIYAEGKGEAQPVTGNRCRNLGAENRRNAKLVACLQPDRRVEIEVVGNRQK